MMINWHALSAAAVLAVVLGAAQAQSVRPEIGKPLQQASELLRVGKAKEALAKVREADAVGGKTAAELILIERMRGAVAQRAGDTATAIKAFESLFPKLSGSEAAQVAEQLASAFSQAKDWPHAGQWAHKAESLGSSSAQLKQLLTYVQAQSGDYGAVARDAASAVSAAEQAGRRPDEGDLLRLADAQMHTGNTAGQTATLEKLLANYPKKEYWGIYLGRLPRKSGFSDRFALDVMRLKLATGNLTSAEEFMEMAQLALQAGYPTEGRAIVDKGYAVGALGNGAEADRHKRLRDLAIKQELDIKASIEQRAKEAVGAKDGTELVHLGYAYVTMGEPDNGIALIEQGIAKGGLKHPEDAKLRLAAAYLRGGQQRAKAVQILRSIQGTDGAADLARLWSLLGSSAPFVSKSASPLA